MSERKNVRATPVDGVVELDVDKLLDKGQGFGQNKNAYSQKAGEIESALRNGSGKYKTNKYLAFVTKDAEHGEIWAFDLVRNINKKQLKAIDGILDPGFRWKAKACPIKHSPTGGAIVALCIVKEK